MTLSISYTPTNIQWQPSSGSALSFQNCTTYSIATSNTFNTLANSLTAPPQVSVTPPPGFNRYVNASDLMEEFIAYLGTEGVRQREVMGLPLEFFIKWLILRACEEDHEEPNVTLELPRSTQPRCLGCQRFMLRDVRVPLHNAHCAGRYFARSHRSLAAAS